MTADDAVPCPNCNDRGFTIEAGTGVVDEYPCRACMPRDHRDDCPAPLTGMPERCRCVILAAVDDAVAEREDPAFTQALTETRTEYREALDRLSDEPTAEDVWTPIPFPIARLLGETEVVRWLAERERAASEKAWDEGYSDVCTDCCCRPDANPYRAEGVRRG